jgi:hypothetical protein
MKTRPYWCWVIRRRSHWRHDNNGSRYLCTSSVVRSEFSASRPSSNHKFTWNREQKSPDMKIWIFRCHWVESVRVTWYLTHSIGYNIRWEKKKNMNRGIIFLLLISYHSLFDSRPWWASLKKSKLIIHMKFKSFHAELPQRKNTKKLPGGDKFIWHRESTIWKCCLVIWARITRQTSSI